MIPFSESGAVRTPFFHARNRAPGAPRWRLACGVVATAALLSACGSTPLPPWPTSQGALPGVVQTQRSVPLPLGQVQGVPGVVTSPVQTDLPTALPGTANDPDAPAYLPALAHRFPDPATRYATPGLAADRRAFSTNAEIGQWLRQLADAPAPATGARTSLLSVGLSQRGLPIHAVVIARASGSSPAQLDASRRPTVLLVGQQHGDEPAGSEALLVVAQELSRGLLEPLLERINVVIVPRANPDGAEAGTRTTASGVDMNRDHLLLSTPEAAALAALARDYRPILVLDAHEFTVAGRYLEKFNAVQRHDALLQYATTPGVPEFFTKASREWYHEPIVAALNGQSLSHEWYHTTSQNLQDLSVSMGGTRPDTLRNVSGLKNAVGFLVETRGIGLGHHHIQRRVHTHITAISSALRSTAERASSLEQVRSFVVRDTSALACRNQVVVEAAATPQQRDLTFIDPQTALDRSIRVEWNSALELRTLKTRPRPCGYWVAQSADVAIERLKLLGVQVLRVAEPGALLVDSYRETTRSTAALQDVRGTATGTAGPGSPAVVKVQVALERSALDIQPGSYYVPLNQPLAALVSAALEPDTQSSYFAHGLLGSLDDAARVMATPSLVFEEVD